MSNKYENLFGNKGNANKNHNVNMQSVNTHRWHTIAHLPTQPQLKFKGEYVKQNKCTS